MTAATTAEIEAVCREFAAKFPTPNVARAIAYAESGRVTWTQVFRLFERALNDAVTEVGT